MRNKKLHRNTKDKICNYYFYNAEFLNWYKNLDNKEIPPLNVKFQKRWRNILDFERNTT